MSKVLSDYVEYVTEKVESSSLSAETYVGMDNMVPNRGGIVASEYVPGEGIATAYRKGDILLGNIRPYFKKIWLAENNGGCSADVLCIRCKAGISPLFIYALLSQDSFFDYDVKGAKGSKMPRGDKDHIMAFPVPELDDPDSVGFMINALYKKIQNNSAICSELESMAKLLYDYWFVQFDFPDENGKPYKSSGGKMVWNEDLKREIPEGWDVSKLGNECEILLGGTPDTTKTEYWDGDIPWLNSGEVACSPVLFAEKRITEDGMNNSATAFAEAGAVVMSITRYIRPSILGINACFNQSVVAVKPTHRFHTSYIYPLMKSNVDRYMKLRTGAQQPHINKETVEETLFLCPSEHILRKYYPIVESLYEQQMNISKESIELTSLRDFLLPMLMNGQVSFKDN